MLVVGLADGTVGVTAVATPIPAIAMMLANAPAKARCFSLLCNVTPPRGQARTVAAPPAPGGTLPSASVDMLFRAFQACQGSRYKPESPGEDRFPSVEGVGAFARPRPSDVRRPRAPP